MYAGAGEAESAIDWLETAARQKHQGVPFIGVNPIFWNLHDQPRFQALAQRIGVPLRKPEGR